jgi:hypothetical protein
MEVKPPSTRNNALPTRFIRHPFDRSETPMRRIATTLASTLTLILALLSASITPAFAQSIRITGAQFNFGSLIAEGNLQLKHLPINDVHLTLTAYGEAEVSCQHEGHNEGDHHHIVSVEAVGYAIVTAHEFNRGGSAKFFVQTGEPVIVHDHHHHHECDDMEIGPISWTAAKILAFDGTNNAEFHFDCRTLPNLQCKK